MGKPVQPKLNSAFEFVARPENAGLYGLGRELVCSFGAPQGRGWPTRLVFSERKLLKRHLFLVHLAYFVHQEELVEKKDTLCAYQTDDQVTALPVVRLVRVA